MLTVETEINLGKIHSHSSTQFHQVEKSNSSITTEYVIQVSETVNNNRKHKKVAEHNVI